MFPAATAPSGQIESVTLIMERGVFCISIDFELAWGFADDPQLQLEFIELTERFERLIVRRMLDLFQKYQHSFGHLVFSHATRDQAVADLDAAARIHKEYGLDFVSFVFPKNAVNHLDVLAQHGIKVFRSGVSTERLSGFGRPGRFLDKLLPIAPRTVQPLLHETGLIELPSCMPFMGRNGIRKLVSPRLILRKVRSALAAAAAQRNVFNF
jgi:hypothetical protein